MPPEYLLWQTYFIILYEDETGRPRKRWEE